jgi:hypothetical protein
MSVRCGSARRFESWLPDYMAGSSGGDRRLTLSPQRHYSGRVEHLDEARRGHGASDIERLSRARIPDAEVTIQDLAGD